ncbi:MAG: bifunctional riboflavin kinase/FAD synthetase [Ignavibacteriae bacterium]|nr:bifunctional riboflavin kinase/FAD synthetase [Ignavibacteria bacterium]MBI3363685.1 bifunctional riboflavin kinase/FAD synthetase [Ignavibacteriota bacterium]
MIVARSARDVGFEPNTVVTVGTFDGVHAGHRSIIDEVIRQARANASRSVVVTFDPHPRTVVGRGPVQLLTTLSERLDLIGQHNVDAVLVLEFTYGFSRQTSREFYERYIIKGTGVREVIIGYDHMFGRNREAGTRELQQLGRELGFTTTIVDPVTIDGDVVNSSKIREMLLEGNVERTQRFLRRPYALEGTVIHGDGRGARIGFPTANVEVPSEEKLVPANGVYLVLVDVGSRKLYGMLNIGIRPTFNAGTQRVIEAHVFDFTDDIYGQRLQIQFLKRLRAEKKFGSVEALVQQLHHDRSESLKHISALQTK